MRFSSVILLFTLFQFAPSSFAAEMKVTKDVPYAEPKSERRMLDLYAPADAKSAEPKPDGAKPDGDTRPGKHPIVVFVHGGGWKAGSKAAVQKKPQFFVDKGFVFISATYRFVPDVTVKEMTADVAKAIKWAHDHAADFNGDPDGIIVMGHSAGAHLAALVCTDDRYLKAEGLSLGNIRGCVPVDVSVYDIPKRLKEGGSVPPATFTAIFGVDETSQRDLSPAAHVAKEKKIPPFLVLHVASRPDTKAQSQAFVDTLKAAGVEATVMAAEGKTHGTINSDLGTPDDPSTKALLAFLDRVTARGVPSKPAK